MSYSRRLTTNMLYCTHMLDKILKNIDIPANAQRVYTCLLQHGSMPARLLAEKINMPRPTVYDALTSLVNVGLVISRDEGGKSIFSTNDPNVIDLIIDQRIDNLTKSKEELQAIIPQLKEHDQSTEPKIRFFSGKEGIKEIFNDILWYKNIETYTVWPMNEMIDLLGEEYLAWHNKRRTERKISLKAIRKSGEKEDFAKFPYLSGDKVNLRQLRYTPKNIDFKMSYWVYADKVTFVSTGPHPFGFIVHSSEFSSMQKINFDLLWSVSKDK